MERQKFSKPAATWKVQNVPIKWGDLVGRYPGKSRYWDPALKVSHSLHIWRNQDMGPVLGLWAGLIQQLASVELW